MVQRFSFGSRRAWLTLSIVVTVLGALELLAAALVLRALLPTPISVALEAILGVATALLLVAFWMPLRSRVVLGPDHLDARLGLVGGIRIDRAQIAGATLHKHDPLHPVEMGIAVLPEQHRAALSRGGSPGALDLHFATEQTLRHQFIRKVPITTLTLAVAEPQALLAALGEPS